MERYTTLNHIQQDIQNNKITIRGLVLHYLNNILAPKHFNSFSEVYADEAKAQAEFVQQKITTYPNGMPDGIQLLGKLFHESERVAIAQTI